MSMIERFKLNPPIDIQCHNKLRQWAYREAYTMIFMSVLFAITWIAMIVYGIYQATH